MAIGEMFHPYFVQLQTTVVMVWWLSPLKLLNGNWEAYNWTPNLRTSVIFDDIIISKIRNSDCSPISTTNLL